MRKALWIVISVAALILLALLAGWRAGLVRAPWSARYDRLAEQLRDRGTVAVVGGVPLGLPTVEASLRAASHVAGLDAALAGEDPAAVARVITRAHLDGLLVRVDGPSAGGKSVRARLQRMEPVEGLTAVFLDESAALYECEAPITLSADDARRLVSVARVILAGAAAPPERIFPESLRAARPVEVGLVVRDGDTPILWRSTRGGSIARAMLDGTFAILNRWSSPLQDRYGRLRDALVTHRLTVTLFHDRGALGSKEPRFVRRAAAAPAWSVGFERMAGWEYVLPGPPGSRAVDPIDALTALARDRAIPAPGYTRPEVTVYRFRAVQLIEIEPFGPVRIDGAP